MPVAHIGRSLRMDLSSSTCVTVQSLQLFDDAVYFVVSDGVTTAALSKKLN